MRMHTAKPFRFLIALAGALLFTSVAGAQYNDLSLGDAAPGLDIEQWLNGSEVTIEDGRTYVVLFFSIEGNDSVRAISILHKLGGAMAGEPFRIIGVTEADAKAVEQFALRHGGGASFPFAVDRRGSTKRNWYNAASLEIMPAAFIVDKRGRIQYMGDPLDDEFLEVLELVLTKRYDANLYEQAEPVFQAIKRSREMRNWRQCLRYLDDLIKTDKYAFAPQVLEKFEVLLVDMNEPERAYEYVGQVMNEYADDPELMLWLAEKIVDDPRIPDEHRNLDVALALVQQAQPQLAQNEPDRFAAEAKVRFHRGEYQQAVRLQRKAYFAAPVPQKERYRKVLTTYMEDARRHRAETP